MIDYRRYLSSTRDDLGLTFFAGYFIIILLIVILFAWSLAVPLADSSLVQGSVTVGRDRQTIVHPYGGRIDHLHVKVGDVVHDGQALLHLDDRDLRSQLIILEHQRFVKQARLDRLESERQGMSSPSFRQSLVDAAKSDPIVHELIKSETRNFEARQDTLQTRDAILDHSIKKASERKKNLRLQISSLDRQFSIVKQQANNAHELWSRGVGTKANAMGLKRELEGLVSQRLNIKGQIDEIIGEINEAELSKKSEKAKQINEIENYRSEISESINQLNEKIDLAKVKLNGMTLFANTSGIVVDLHVRSANDVILPASPIMEIVPENIKPIVEASVPPNEIDGIYEGANVEVRFPAFAREYIPKVVGEVSVVSADVVADGNDPSYKVYIKVNDWENIGGDLDVIPGMPVDIIIKKKSRTFLQYMITPISDKINRALL